MMRTRLTAVALGAMTAAFGWIAATSLAGAGLEVTMSGTTAPVGIGEVVAAATVAGTLGWVLLVIVERLSSRPRRRLAYYHLIIETKKKHIKKKPHKGIWSKRNPKQ